MLWKTIPGCSNYQVSDCGAVRRDPSKRMRGWGPKRPPGSLLHPCYHDQVDAYLVVRLHNDSGKNVTLKIHQLVCAAFHGPRPTNEHCALHRNDCRHDNHYHNLYWGTKKQNAIDREKNGSSGTACLNSEEVRWVKELYTGDARGIREIAAMFDVKPHVIRGIITKKTYTWVTSGMVQHNAV